METSNIEMVLADALRKVNEVEKLTQNAKEMQLVKALTESLNHLEFLRKDFEDSKRERLEAKQFVEDINSKLDSVLALLTQYVADNKRAVDGINQYLKDWQRD